MRRKVVLVVGLFAILFGINMQVNALNPADGIAGKNDQADLACGSRHYCLELRSVTIHVGDHWQPRDNFVRAYDEYGRSVDFSEIEVRGADFPKDRAGTFGVSYILHARSGDGAVVTAANVIVLNNQASLEVKDSKLNIGADWKPADNLVKATDANGNEVDIDGIEVDGKVDTSKAGINKVTYKIANISKVATITVQEDQTSLTVKDSEIYVGDRWDPKDNLVEAINKDGEHVGLETAEVGAEGWVDAKTPGTYIVTYTIYNAKNEPITKEAKVTVKEDKTSIETNDSQLYLGAQWKPIHNFISATDKDGKRLTIDDVTVDGNVDTSKPATYYVTYSVLNHAKEPISKTAKINVKADQTTLEVKDTTLYLNDTWKPEDNLVRAFDKDGKTININDITVEGSVDPKVEGTYKVTYTILNYDRDKVSKTATITVKKDQTSINVKDSTLNLGEKWSPKDNFVSATDKDGNSTPFETRVRVAGDVDSNKVGEYKVTYGVFNHKSELVSKVATITVEGDLTSIDVKDSTLYTGDQWKPEDNFVKATSINGDAVDFKDVTVDGKADTSKAGEYKVTYSILNANNEKVSKTATITVKEDKTNIEVKDSKLYVTDKWNKADNFVSATDKDGKTLTIEDVTVDGNVDTSKEGTYEVTYTVLNHAKAKVSKTAKIYVYSDQTKLEVKDTTLYKGDTWKPEDNVVRAFDKDGKEININDITVEGSVDPAVEGTYKVTYTILNYLEEKISEVATITVKGNDLTELEVKDSTLYAGDTWKAEDNLVKAVDMNGKAIDIKDVTVEGKVDVTKEGVYKVKYTIANHKNEKISKEATITVKGNDLTNIEVKNSMLYVGQKWNPADNLVKAIDKDGKEVGIDGVTYTGEVDTDKAGTYKVEFAILNHKQEKVKATASIFVTADQTTLDVKDSTIYLGDSWKPEDNFVSATDKDGNPVGIEAVDVKGDVNTSEAGTYNVTYEISNSKGTKVVREALITVKADQTTLEVKDTKLYKGDTWQPEDNIVKALDKDGKAINIKDIIVEGAVDPATEGSYQVKYTIVNHLQEKISKEATITVKGDDLTTLEVKDSTLYAGDTWKAEDNLVKAIDKDGEVINIKDITVEGSVDVTKEDVYKVKYTIVNHKNEKVSKVATITVKGKDLTTLEVKGSVLYLNEEWNPEDNIVKALDKDGNKIDIKDIVIDGEVNTAVAKDYTVKFTILNHKKEPVTRATVVKVKEDLTSLEVKDSVLYFGDRWQPEDNLVKATDKDGNPLDIYDIDVKGDVDIKTAGDYPVEYTIYNNAKEKITKIATVTMKGHDYTYLEVDDSTLYVGDKWNPADNLIKARDKDGNELGIEDVTVEGDVDTSKAGTYEVVYSLLNHNNDKLSNIATITVKEDQTSLKVKNSTLYLNDQWNPADNFVSATDKDGNDIAFKDVVVESNVDTSKTGICKAKYTILDHKGEKITKTANVIVKKDHTYIEVKDSTLYLSDTWKPEDNLVKAVDKDGNAIKIKNITVKGEVDTAQVGIYQVTYTILNHKKEEKSALANIRVKEDQTSLIVKDSELYLDDEWNPADNIVEAIDKDGNVIEDIAVIAPQADENENKAKVIVEGNVDTSNEGVSKLTYTIFDHANTKITKEVAVNIKVDKTSLQVRDTIIRLNSKWKPADNLVRAMDQDGKDLNIKDVTVTGKVNTRKAGKYKVTYTIMNHADKKISKKATVTVQKKKNGNGDGNGNGNGNGNGSGSGKDGNGNLPKTGYDMSIIGSLLGLAGVLGFGSLYLNRRERKE